MLTYSLHGLNLVFLLAQMRIICSVDGMPRICTAALLAEYGIQNAWTSATLQVW